MTPEAQRIAIANASPQTACKNINGAWVWREQQSRYFDPLNDLNAMQAAEGVLTDDQAWEQVKLIVDYKQSANGFPFLSRSETLKLHSATAAQRAEAWLKAKNLWKE